MKFYIVSFGKKLFLQKLRLNKSNLPKTQLSEEKLDFLRIYKISILLLEVHFRLQNNFLEFYSKNHITTIMYMGSS